MPDIGRNNPKILANETNLGLFFKSLRQNILVDLAKMLVYQNPDLKISPIYLIFCEFLPVWCPTRHLGYVIGFCIGVVLLTLHMPN